MSESWADPSPFSAELGSLKATGAGVSWAINDCGGQALISAAEELHDELGEILLRAEQLAQELPLGTTPAAQVYKPFIATVASDPAQGAIPVLKKLREEVLDFRGEVEKAMAAYETSDRNNQQIIEQAGGFTA
ncbi:hypothetical protein BBK82_43635 [Lentzea guizhouensis]|uniref:PE domain-containing protein n=1 Tax=Lentzea guizhouensis TaxID=1586287 RepID=A0A1B2HVT0_9PSEU|nr:hypothetical protein [Lentzea guizhouensis]ANZ41813.1 hypothetical protein BBK82_43635 [Lentzea guizhouensis]